MTRKLIWFFAAIIMSVFLATSAKRINAQQPEPSPVVTPSPTPAVKTAVEPIGIQPKPTPPDVPVKTMPKPVQSPQIKNTGGRVSVTSLVEAALEANPEITVMRREFDATRARIPQAKALPDPTVSFTQMTVGNPIPFAGNRNDGFFENDFGVSQDFPWFGVRRLRGQIASAESEAKFQEYAATVRRITSEVKAAYYDLYYTERALTVLARDKDILEKMAQVAEVRYSVGKAQQVDIINARVEITELVHRQGELEIQRETALARLNNLLFREQGTPIGELAPVRMNPELPPFEELMRLASENAPELAQQRRLIDAGSKAVRLAEREAKYPEVGVSFMYRQRPRFQDYYSYQVSLKLPIYAASKQRYAIEEQSANLSAARSRLNSNVSLVASRLREARERARITARQIRLHEQGLIPQATLALESSLSAYQVGQLEFITLLTALKRALDYETQYYQLVSENQKALAEIERYTGVELTR